ncbi:putative carnitinyl-CoA dehydratase [Calycina marina]|uniref:Carnitinyl-CoA dehydratase n=1 Tax=Calycina marina TaxID=1763456 RepID=A0A9P7Z8Z5_9HELO|nr:putative carnitinyl-CoA dehydratase [Calycina marina]
MATALFTLPIQSKDSSSSVGSFTCSSPSDGVYVLTFTSPPDNRLVTNFCQTFLLALDILEFSHPPGVVVTTSGIEKFYSNGLDLEHAFETKGYFPDSLYALWKRLITYPMPTIAVVNGHAFAGGLMTAMYHDYRIFNPARGFLCLNELEFGVALRGPMSSVFRQKVTPQIYRSLVLEAKRFNSKEALDGGIVDVLGGMDEALALIKDRKLTKMGKTGIYGLMKMEMFRESIAYTGDHAGDDQLFTARNEAEDTRQKAGKKRVEQWEKAAHKSGLKARL